MNNNKLLNNLKPKSEFTKNVLTLMTGTTIAQAIPVAISPILTRLYTPEDFGVFALYMSLASIGSLIATGRYELAIMLPADDEESINLVYLSITITLLISIISLIFIYILNAQIVKLLKNKEVSNWLYLIPASIFFTGIYQSFNYWINRKKYYKILAKSRVARSTGISIMNIGLGLANLGSGGLILGNVTGQAVGSFVLLKNSKDVVENKKKVCFSKMLSLAKKYKKMPIFNLPNALIDGFRISGINILISNFFDSLLLGQFSLAWRVIQTPASLIGSSISQVLFEKFSKAEKHNLNKLIIEFLIKASLVVFPVFLLLYFFSPAIFSFIFGAKWRIAGIVVSALSPWLFVNFLTSPISTVFLVINKQEIALIFSIIYMLTPIFLIIVFHSNGFIPTLKIISFAMSIILFLLILAIIFYTSKRGDK